MRHRAVACGLGAVLLTFLGGCRVDDRPAAERELPTVEVAPPADADLSTGDDIRAVPRAPAVSGVLPGDFPTDLPLYAPSSLVDFGAAAGRRWVTFFSPDRLSVVRGAWSAKLEGAGWSPGEETGPGVRVYRKGARSLRIAIADAQPGTEIRIEY